MITFMWVVNYLVVVAFIIGYYPVWVVTVEKYCLLSPYRILMVYNTRKWLPLQGERADLTPGEKKT